MRTCVRTKVETLKYACELKWLGHTGYSSSGVGSRAEEGLGRESNTHIKTAHKVNIVLLNSILNYKLYRCRELYLFNALNWHVTQVTQL